MAPKRPEIVRADLGERIRQLRRERGLTQAQLAAALNVTKNAVTNWESGASRPDLSLLPLLCAQLGISCDELLGRTAPASRITKQEREHLLLYRRLNGYDRRSVDALLASILRGYDEAWLDAHRADYRRIPEFGLSFAAGSGHPLDSEPEKSHAFLLRQAQSEKADFIVRVSGRSMEPTFQDGDRVLVERRTNLRPGEIGIFRLPDGEGLIKEYQRDGLHSHNPAFPVRKPQELAGMVCLGHVLGPVEESLLPDQREAALLENAYSAGKLTF